MIVEHDMHVGKLLDKLDAFGITENTNVYYSTDNGPHMNTWPDAAMTPFRGEKKTNWEAAGACLSFPRIPSVAISGGSTLTALVEAADLQQRDDLPGLRSLDRARLASVPCEREARPASPDA